MFHWHGETFDLPPGATLLAAQQCLRQPGISAGRNVIGLQFHLETTPDSADAIITGCRDELAAGDYVQTEAALRAAGDVAYTEINALMGAGLDSSVQ